MEWERVLVIILLQMVKVEVPVALIKCGECEKEISDQAASCPGCGAPIKKLTAASATTKKKTSKAAWVGLVVVILGIIWFTQTRDFKETSLPALPIEVGVRDAMLGSGKVLQVKNTSKNTLMVIVDIKNPTTKQEKSFRLDIPAGGMTEIGHMEGWVVASGDAIQVRNEGYQTWTGSAP